MMSNGFRRERNSQNEGIQEHVPVGLQKLMRTFDPKESDISFYLILFERQARRNHIKEENWVTNIVGLLPLEMANLIARKSEEKANDYEHIKVVSGLKIYDFDRLKQLVIEEQMKEPVSRDMQQHFINDWSRIVTVDDVTEKQEFNNRNGYDKRNSFQKSVTCFNCGRGKVAEIKVSEVQVAEVKVVEDESKVVTARFNVEVVRENKKCSAVQLKMSDLKIVNISYGRTEYEAVVDSGAQISVFKSSVVGKEVDYKRHIMLQPAFGDCLKAEQKEVDIDLVTNGYITPVIKTVVATVDGLNTDILLDTEPSGEPVTPRGRVIRKRTGKNSPLNLKRSAPFLRHTPSTRKLQSFDSHINAAAKRSIPRVKRRNNWVPFWKDTNIKNLINERDKLSTELQKNNTETNRIRFRNLCHEVEEVISCKRKKWTEFCETLDPQKISQHWKVIKTLNNQSTHQEADLLTNIISSSGRDAATNKETASLLAKHYENKSKLTFNANDRKLLRTYRKTIQDSKRYNHKNIFTIPFLMEELEATIAKMNLGKVPGPDVIFGRMFRHFGNLAKKNYWKFLTFLGLLENCPRSGNFPPSFNSKTKQECFRVQKLYIGQFPSPAPSASSWNGLSTVDL
ncbi:retrovirus-related Pol polyprotein from transposon opus [Trichonephila clavipes]|nr:retrovirus-related Pol polyprotein from transposon opus [Trichonephila clavipes]